MKQIIKEQIATFVSEYNRVCERQMIAEFENDSCFISGEEIISSTFIEMFEEAFPEKPLDYYIGVRGTSIYMCIYKSL